LLVLEMQKPKIESEVSEESFGRFTVEPLERGWGYTLGNSMRRILLSSIPGAAINALLIEGVMHEFSTIPGVKEDTIEITLNLKGLVLKMHEDGPVSLFIDAKGPKTVTGADIEAPSGVEILNPELKIATLNKDGKLKMEMIAARSHGYVPVERSKRDREAVGTIPMDAMYSPITRVSFKVTNCRVGQRTDYDKLILDVHTDGSVRPDEALSIAGTVLNDHIKLFSSLSEVEVETHPEPKAGPGGAKLERSIDELELPVRALNCLHREQIRTVGELIERTEDDLLAMRNFGSRSIEEVKERLAAEGLELKKGEFSARYPEQDEASAEKPEAEQESTPLEDLAITASALNALQDEGISTVEQLVEKTEDELLAIPKFTKASLEKTKKALAELERELKSE
jgi:DNA-directed RNA polymerase subunit alpha